ncbi:MAG TPA: helix-turn-helix transcriptional regulator [Vicinamibacterales bacterium]|nr:helix-turn-helix transcriptional regulator [Vicinamibacterales bacterium]
MKRPSRAASAGAPLPLTPVEFHILLSLADGDRHGYAILQDVSQRSDNQVRLRTGTLYTVIKRMLDSGWIAEAETPADEADERRRYYRLTPIGRDVVRNEAKRLQALVTLAQEKRVLGRPRRIAPERAR